MDDAAPGSERRAYRRYAIWFPVTLKTPTSEVWAICRDASVSGVLLSCVMPVEVGTRVEAVFKVTPDSDAERTISGRVVRQTSNKDELLLAFPHRVAVEFDAPVSELLEELTRHTESREAV